MKFNKSKMLAAAAIAVGLTAAGAGAIHAQADTNSNPMGNLVNAIATKFNLNASDVQQVFDDQHQQMEAQHQQKYQDFLSQAVTDDKLTQEQADKIIAKQAELKSQREADKDNFQNMTNEERKAAMDEQRIALKQWAEDNNIPQQYLRFGFGRGHGHGGPGQHERGFGPDSDGDQDDSQSNS